jgi:hypothetical protein
MFYAFTLLRNKLVFVAVKNLIHSLIFKVCAFANTPKFREVKTLGGKIVKKEWLEACHKDRKRYPWRRFCLDPGDRGEESEEEIWC